MGVHERRVAKSEKKRKLQHVSNTTSSTTTSSTSQQQHQQGGGGCASSSSSSSSPPLSRYASFVARLSTPRQLQLQEPMTVTTAMDTDGSGRAGADSGPAPPKCGAVPARDPVHMHARLLEAMTATDALLSKHRAFFEWQDG